MDRFGQASRLSRTAPRYCRGTFFRRRASPSERAQCSRWHYRHLKGQAQLSATSQADIIAERADAAAAILALFIAVTIVKALRDPS
jgi:hypothetical protein